VSEVALSLGSNMDAHRHLRVALDALYAEFGELRLSSVFESEAVGFQGANFLNMVVVINTDTSLQQLIQFLKSLEDQHGRTREGSRFSGRTLDIDILTCDELQGEFAGITLPRAEILENAYVLWPLAQLLGAQLHPACGKSYEALWRAYDRSRQRLWPVGFIWNDQVISRAGPAPLPGD
jgi:2-amino-4-hydroxy-6-hydroxymethyldihydropteridine diphosphokinase